MKEQEEYKPIMEKTIQAFNQRGKDFLPGKLGIMVTDVGTGTLAVELAVTTSHLAPNG
ncbi:MAG: hypothetical protein H7315_13045, partial [Herminiimonas sp.]|nr:hypothetical protein [Herminiimonas sp.]